MQVIVYGLPATVSPAVRVQVALPVIPELSELSLPVKPLRAAVSDGSVAPYVLPLAAALTERVALATVRLPLT